MLNITCKLLVAPFRQDNKDFVSNFPVLCRICVVFMSVPCWRKNEIGTKRLPRGPRLMIFPEVRIIFYAESDGNGPGAQNQRKRTENEQRPNLMYQLIQDV